MSKYWKRIISIVITCMMVITLVPFAGSKVNATSLWNIGKITLKMAPGSLIQPGFEEDIPSDVGISLDETDDSADSIAMSNANIQILRSYWAKKDIESYSAEQYTGSAVEGTYRIRIQLKIPEQSSTAQYNFRFDKDSTEVYVDGEKWELAAYYDTDRIEFWGPEYKVEEGTTAVYKPEVQPSNESTKITGAPKNLVCSVDENDPRHIRVEFEPDLECGIDKNCGIVIAASTDNQATWQKVRGWDFVSDNKDLKWDTYALSDCTGFDMDFGKTYYVKAYYVDSEGKKGPDSNICGPFGPVEKAGEAEGPDPNFHIYLAFGESNMAGMGPIEEEDLEVDYDFMVMCTTDTYNYNGTERELGKWYTAKAPLAGSRYFLGVADYFGRRMLEEKQNNDPNVKIGIIVVAVPGAHINYFNKDFDLSSELYYSSAITGFMKDYGDNPYGRLIECAKKAQKDGVIKGIIMHMGESDQNNDKFPSNVKNVYDNIVADLDLADNTPLLAGEVLRSGNASNANMNIAKLEQQSKNFHVVSSEGFHNAYVDGQNIHFTSAEYREFGKRYADKMLKIEGFEKKTRYTIKVSSSGNGGAYASQDWGVTGKDIKLRALPDKGYKFKEWLVNSGDVTIADDKFTVGTKNVEIHAIFEKIEEPTTKPTATPMPEPTPTLSPTPEATPIQSPTVAPTEAPVEYKDGDEYKDEASNTSYKVTSTKKLTISLTGLINKNAAEIVVPDKVTIGDKTYKVTEIAPNAFKNNKKLKKFTIGKNIEKIGKNAFYGCKNLKTIKIKTLKLKKKNVGKNAFKKINKKARITVPKKKLKDYKKILKARGVTGKKQKIKK
ncbi:MAG: leucine-rich repeat protein [Eubacterium sp.]|nr:leucine-rich repeat protein [Eubacterium sp.]